MKSVAAKKGQLREGEGGGLYLVLDPVSSDGFDCYRCLIVRKDDHEREELEGASEDIPEQWLRVYTRVVA